LGTAAATRIKSRNCTASLRVKFTGCGLPGVARMYATLQVRKNEVPISNLDRYLSAACSFICKI
jgi:hypothetical protein